MLINDIDIKNFKGKVEKKMFNHGNDKNTGRGALSIKLLFSGTNREEVHKHISNFIVISMNECTIKFKNLSNFFNVIYVDHSIEETGFDEYLSLEIEFEYFEFEPEITHTFLSGKTITVKGNLKTNAKVIITSKIDLIDCVLEGVTEEPIKIKNLKANKQIVIDGIEGLITEEGKNKFKDVDLWEFPRLIPGTNTISVNKENINIEIKYTAKWR